MKITITGDREFLAALRGAEAKALRGVPLVLKAAGQRTAHGTRNRISRSSRWAHLRGAVGMDMRGPLAVEVGYNKGGSGSLGNIAEFGSAHHAPHPALVPAFEQESKILAKEFEALLGKLVQ